MQHTWITEPRTPYEGCEGMMDNGFWVVGDEHMYRICRLCGDLSDCIYGGKCGTPNFEVNDCPGVAPSPRFL